MESTMQDALAVTDETKASRKRVKPKAIKESAFAAGLAAFAALETDEGATRPAQITARTLVCDGIESIMRARARGVPLLRIYSDAKKAAGLRIGFATFSGYVCEAAKAAGIKLEKPKAEAGSSARHQPDAEPAHVADQTAPVEKETASMDGGWNCAACAGAERHESTKKPGNFYWRCPKCGAFYEDAGGQITNKRLVVR